MWRWFPHVLSCVWIRPTQFPVFVWCFRIETKISTCITTVQYETSLVPDGLYTATRLRYGFPAVFQFGTWWRWWHCWFPGVLLCSCIRSIPPWICPVLLRRNWNFPMYYHRLARLARNIVGLYTVARLRYAFSLCFSMSYKMTMVAFLVSIFVCVFVCPANPVPCIFRFLGKETRISQCITTI